MAVNDYINIEPFGKVHQVHSNAEFAELLQEIDFSYGYPGLWRGQSKAEWPLHSSAVRRILKFNDRIGDPKFILEDEVRKYEKLLLSDARRRGYGFHQNRELSDLELLASLQHYGAATRLLDFSQSAYVALWFACRDDLDDWGMVFGLDISGYKNLRDSKDGEGTVPSILDNKTNGKGLARWESPFLYERMRVQYSVFILSICEDKKWGSIAVSEAFDENEYLSGDLIAIAIAPEMKKVMRQQWSLMFGFSIDTMFPDIAGFGLHHSWISPFEWDFFLR